MSVPSAGFRHSPFRLVSGAGGWGYSLKVQVYERVGILLVEYERVEKTVIWAVRANR